MNCTRKHRCFDLRSLLLCLAKPPNVWSNNDRAKMKKDKSQKQLTLVESLTRGGEKKEKKDKQTNKIAHTWSARLKATSYSSHHHQTMLKTTSEPKKKPFNRRRKKLLELQCFLSVDWYKQQTMRVLLSEHRHHIQVPPRRSTYVKDVCSSENIPYAHARTHARTHKGVTQNNEVADGGSPYRERDSVSVYDSEYGVCILAEVNAQVLPSPPPPPPLLLFLLDWWWECRNYLPGWKRKWTMVKKVNKRLGQGGTSVKNQVSMTINTSCEKWGDVKRGVKVHYLARPGKGLSCGDSWVLAR